MPSTERQVPDHRVRIRDVAPRDGLQAEQPIPVEGRIALIHALLDAGVDDVEAVAFVSPKAVPSMAGADAVLAGIRPLSQGQRLWALVPNLRGAELALATGRIDGLTVTVSASEAYSQKNVHLSVEESIRGAGAICKLAASGAGRASGDPVPVDVVVSCAFGSPWEGDLNPEQAAALGRRLLDGGATSLTFADTTGMALPGRIDDLVDSTGIDIGLHLHETRRTGLLNAWAAVQRGVSRFDTSVGGIGGSPFAAGAAGNLATEDLVHLLDDSFVETGIDLNHLLDAADLLALLLGRPVPCPLTTVGPRSRLVGP